ncbi:MAG: outer membrane beta-barrel protein [Bdellovibrionia bacterium]
MKRTTPWSQLKSQFFAFFIPTLFLTGVSAPSYALDFSVLGAVSSSNYSVTPQLAASAGGVGFGGGATLGFDLAPFFSLETGAVLVNHPFSATSLSSAVTVNYNYLEIPLLLRFTPVSFVSLAAGPYYGISSSISASGVIPTELQAASLGGAYVRNNDYGLMFGGGIRLPLLPLLRLRFDVFYKYGLANLSAGSASQYARNVDVWAGLMFGF